MRLRRSGARSLGLLVAHEFDADHQALAANVADDLVALAPVGRVLEDERSPIAAALSMYCCSSKSHAWPAQPRSRRDCRRKWKRARPASSPSRWRREMIALSGMPEAMPFAVQIMSGSMPA